MVIRNYDGFPDLPKNPSHKITPQKTISLGGAEDEPRKPHPGDAVRIMGSNNMEGPGISRGIDGLTGSTTGP
jgi:hypothetical protein